MRPGRSAHASVCQPTWPPHRVARTTPSPRLRFPAMTTHQGSPSGRIAGRVKRELHGRSPIDAGRDLGRLFATQGVRGLLQGTGPWPRAAPDSEPAESPPVVDPRVHSFAWGSAHNPHFDLTPDV